MRGLYTALTALSVGQARLEVTSNNLANERTPGYKKDRTQQSSFQEMLIAALPKANRRMTANPRGRIAHGVALSEINTLHTEGVLEYTERMLDLAIVGEGFFVVETPQGFRLTRNGNFHLNDEGFLVTPQGDYLRGENGPLAVGEEPLIDRDGNIYVGERLIDRLELVMPAADAELVKEGNGYFRVDGQLELFPAAVNIYQGYLEGANVDLAQEMVELVRIRRSYEAARGVVATYDQLLSRGANEVGTLR
ncbi:MAG: flagellar hook-basal body protein [Dethiobacteria bacterium]|nr:flagellar hook-basal body protein [Bacillota bacterium]